MAVIEVTSSNFEEEVLKSPIPVLADFNAEWCGPCKAMKPILEELSQNNDRYKIVSINIDDEDDLTDEYDVSSIPCLVVFEGGKEVNRNVGLIPKDAIEELIGE